MPRFYRNNVDLFSSDEHAVLADWLGLRSPNSARGIIPEEAMARLGFQKEPGHYRLIDAAVAFIVLENAEKRLPGWSALRADGSFVCARDYRDEEQIPDRKVLLQSRQNDQLGRQWSRLQLAGRVSRHVVAPLRSFRRHRVSRLP
jgi:hypothetical protein